MRRSEYYKKTYKAGEKVYRLIYSSFKVKIVQNTVYGNISKNDYYGRNTLYLRHNNFGYGTNVPIVDIAPRTVKGKNFLNKKARKFINRQIKNITHTQNEYKKLLSKFKDK